MIPKGYKHTELGVLPEDWEVVRLGDVCEINPKSLELPDTFIYIDLESVSKGKLCSVKYMKKTNAPSRAKRTLQRHDILFQMVRPYQKNNLYFNLEGGYVASTGYAQIRTKQSSGFIFQYIHTQTFVERVIEKCTGSNYPAINATDLSQIEIPLPPLAEQEKIAEILSAWDTQIQNFETLIAEKQTLKKGFCQTLLTAKTRLKGFGEDWEVVRLGDVCDVRDGTHESPKPTTEGKILITSKNLKGGKINFLDSYHISLEDFEAINKRSKVEKYDILMSMIGTVGEVAFVDIEPNFAIKNVALFKMDGNEKFSKFLFFFFQSSIGKKHILGSLSGSTQKYITLDFLRNLQIPIPPFTEQEKIAEILSEADNEITLLEQKLESLKSQKRGLMQNLLNGKVRTRI